MATVLTEGRRTGDYLAWEADPNFSREKANVPQGQVLKPGDPVTVAGGNMTKHAGVINSSGALVAAVSGICYDNYDATDAAIPNAVYTARDATVNDTAINYATESTAGGEKAAMVAALKALNIIPR